MTFQGEVLAQAVVDAPLTAVEMVEGFSTGAISPVEIMRKTLARSREVDAVCNAFCLIDEERAMADARASERRWAASSPVGRFDGVPIAVKDTAHVLGWPSRSGSLATSEVPSERDGWAIARLRDSGAVFFGKTTTPEFGWKALTESPRTGLSLNPWNTALTPGGSSGGSAIAVSAGVCPIATAGDGGGSIRIPAAFTGTFGLKATLGLLPDDGGYLGMLGVFGCLSRTVRDSALFYGLLTEAGDPPASMRGPAGDFVGALSQGVRGMRIAYSPDLGFGLRDEDTTAAVRSALDILADEGAQIEEVSLDLSFTRSLIDPIWRAGFGWILRDFSKDAQALMDPALLALAESSRAISAYELQRAYDETRELGRRMDAFHADYALLITPTVPVAPFAAALDTPDPTRFPTWFDWAPLTWPFNLTRQPAASVHCGFSGSNLPIGLQLVGSRFGEAAILRAAQCLETAIGPAPRSPL